MPANRLILLLAATAACGPTKPDQSTDASTSSASSSTSSETSASTDPPATEPTSSAGTDEPPNPATSEPPDPSASTVPPDTSATSEPPNPTTATVPGETGDTTTGELIPCDVGLQDCPEGMKCSVFTEGTDNIFQGMFKCVPVDPDPQPPHAPCDVFGDPLDGTDNCELGSICLDLDDSGAGECFAFCDFSSGDPVCAIENDVCIGATCQTCTWSFCDANCNLLDPDTCAPTEACIPGGDSWVCAPDASGDIGEHGDPCEFANACDPGHACVDAVNLPACDGPSCCAVACDVTAPQCPQGVQCEPWYEEGTAPSAELAKVGVCIL